MRFFWRNSDFPLLSHDDWLERIDVKNRRQGTSAPTLATSWAGPLDLLGALATVPELAGITLNSVTPEAKASFDAHGGNVRNHDLVLRGTTLLGDSVVVCVEAKAGETLGDPVAMQRRRAEQAKEAKPDSKALARLDDLLDRFCRYPGDDPRTKALYYQLLTGWAGTLTDAASADHAVFAVHEFRTDQRPDDKTFANRVQLDRFADAVLGCELPAVTPPWCVRVPAVKGLDAKLYLAHLITDLRRERLQGV